MAALVSTLVTMISMIFDLVGRLIGAVFQAIFLLAACAPDENSSWPNEDDRLGAIPEDDAQRPIGYNNATGLNGSGADPDSLHGIEPDLHQHPSYW